MVCHLKALYLQIFKQLTLQTFHFTIFNIGMEVVSQGVLTGVILLPFIVGIIILFRRSQTRIPLLVYPDSTKVLSQSSINDADLAGGMDSHVGVL